VAIVGLAEANPQAAYGSAALLMALNAIFLLGSAFIAWVVARGFLVRASAELLVLGAGVVVFGSSSVVAAAVGSGDPNVAVTIHNLGVFLAAGCHVAAAVLTLRPVASVRRPALALGAAYAAALAAMALVAIVARAGGFPTFFVQGQGGTAVRQVVLGSSIAAFGIASGVMWTGTSKVRSAFRHWYAVGLALVAVGLFGVLLESAIANVLSWLGRGAQYLGSFSMLLAAAAAAREARRRVLPLGSVLRETQEPYRALFDPQPGSVANVRDRETLYGSLFTLAPSGVVLVDEAGVVLAFNDRAHEQLGYTRQEFARLHLSDVDVDEQRADVARHVSAMDAAGGGEFEARHRTRSGEIRDVLVRARPVDLGGARLLLNVWEDITERKRVERRTERQRAIITGIARIFEVALTCESEEELGSACLAVAESVTQSRFGFLGEVNATTDRLVDIAISDPGWDACSMPRSSPGGKRVAIPFVIHGIYGRVLRDGRSLITNDPGAHPDRIGTPPGHPPLRAFLGVPILHAGRVWGMIGLGNRAGGYGPDELVATEVIAPAILQAFMRRRAEDELRRADQRKTDFLAVLSHELRNPLTPIRNSVHLLDRAPPGSPQIAHASEVIRRQTAHLARLVDEILDLTRIERGKVEIKRARIDLREVARKTVDDLHSLFEGSGLNLRVYCESGPVWVDADATRLSQVLGNLLQNAAKFTPPGGNVSVSVGLRGGRAEVAVRDTGVGIEAAELARIFQPFAQADRTLARTRGGLGLGLSLVKGIVELHGGSVVARSDGAGRGAEFVISLPSFADAEASPGVRTRAGAPSRRRILIVEDNVDAGDSLADVLRLDGHEVLLARDGRSGLASALDFEPEVVLCDVGLPDLDGYEVARALRAQATLGSCRLVALTGYAQPEDRERARQAGFDHHIAKPPDLEALREVLADLGPADQG
jgi:PAS domain S-box-containing protein